MGVLANKTRVLVTHQLQFVNQADLIVVLKGGKISEIGTYNQLMESRQEFYTLISTHVKESKSESTEEEKKDEKKKDETKKPTTSGSTGKLVQAEERDTGNVDAKVYKAYMMALGGTLIVAAVSTTFLGYKDRNSLRYRYWVYSL
jgi:ABC-type glutathione transport system ATPase component